MKDSVTAELAGGRLSVCSISGMCWWVPPTLYADSDPITSVASRLVVEAAPGAGRPRRGDDDDVIRLHECGGEEWRKAQRHSGRRSSPGWRRGVAPRSTSRAEGSSGSPYVQVPAWSPP